MITRLVQQTMQIASTRTASAPETAACTQCGGTLRFFTDAYGQTLERCDTRACAYHRPHRPIAVAELAPPYVPKRRKPRRS